MYTLDFFSNFKHNITSLSLLAGRTVHGGKTVSYFGLIIDYMPHCVYTSSGISGNMY